MNAKNRIQQAKESIEALASEGVELSAGQVADALGVTSWQVTEWARSGRFPGAHKILDRWLIPAQSILDFEPGDTGRIPDSPIARELLYSERLNG